MCQLMRQELIFHALMHDLRGGMTALMGWQSLLADQNSKAVQGLGRSISGIGRCIRLFSGSPEPSWPETGCDLTKIARDLGIGFEGPADLVEIDSQRLEAASWMAGATGMRSKKLPGQRMEIQIEGLPALGLRLLLSPQSASVLSAAEVDGPIIGTCLFKEVVRGVRGDYVSDEDSGLLCLRVPVGAAA